MGNIIDPYQMHIPYLLLDKSDVIVTDENYPQVAKINDIRETEAHLIYMPYVEYSDGVPHCNKEWVSIKSLKYKLYHTPSRCNDYKCYGEHEMCDYPVIKACNVARVTGKLCDIYYEYRWHAAQIAHVHRDGITVYCNQYETPIHLPLYTRNIAVRCQYTKMPHCIVEGVRLSIIDLNMINTLIDKGIDPGTLKRKPLNYQYAHK